MDRRAPQEEPGRSEPGKDDAAESASGGKQGFAPIRRHWKLVVLGGVLLAAAAGAYWWFFLHNRVSTDDAYVHANVAQVTTRVPGTVLRVLVRDDDPVGAGQTLLELDPTDYRVALDRAQAALAQTEAEIQAARVSISETDVKTSANVQAETSALQAAREKEAEVRHRLQELRSTRSGAMADRELAQSDFERFDNLYRQGAGSGRQRQEAQTTLEKIKARVSAIDAQIEAEQRALAAANQDVARATARLDEARGTRNSVEVQRHKLAALEAAKSRAKAEVEQARLNLSYTTVTAAIAGYVAQKTVQVGDRVQPGQALMAVVPLDDVYVEANFKETDLANVRIGQPATIEADMYSGHTYRGTVAGIRAGTGAAFSLLPPENATGNWIKVVRRIPVRIELERPLPKDFPLRLGMSTVVTVDTSDRSGPVLRPQNPASAASPSAPVAGAHD